MKDREYERLKRRIERIFDAWRLRLGLRWWSIKLVYDRVASPRDTSDEELAGEVKRCEWKYLQASMYFYMNALSPLSQDDLEKVVVHELCHVLVSEMRESDDDHKHEERVVTTLTQAFIWTRYDTAKRTRKLRRKK